MGLFDMLKPTPPKVEVKIEVEVIKGELLKDALVEAVKKEFALTENVSEAVLLGDLEKCDLVFRKTIENSFIKISVAPGLTLSYLLFVSNNNVAKIVGIVSDSIDVNLQTLLDSNKQIVRINKSK